MIYSYIILVVLLQFLALNHNHIVLAYTYKDQSRIKKFGGPGYKKFLGPYLKKIH